MLERDEALRDLRLAAVALLECSRAARARSAELMAKAAATRKSVGTLIEHAQSTCAAIRSPKADNTGPSAKAPETAVDAVCGGGDDVTTAPVSDQDPVTRAMFAVGLSEADLAGLADDLIAALENARAWRDEENIAALSVALIQIGRHWANRIGPRAAGVILH